MLTSERTIRVQWGDCDPAGIVYFPRYFEWFDASTMLLFEKATGLIKIRMLAHYACAGVPVVDVRAVFKAASQYGDDINVVTQVTEFRRASFVVHHRVTKGDMLALEGFETRVWTVRDPGNDNRLRSGNLPPEVVAAFGAARKP
jgi:4-hydroxybenzoyl-CoA thioesterase